MEKIKIEGTKEVKYLLDLSDIFFNMRPIFYEQGKEETDDKESD